MRVVALGLVAWMTLGPGHTPMSGCGAAGEGTSSRQTMREERRKMRARIKAEDELSEAAEAFWTLVRWRSWGEATSFVEDPDDRMALIEHWDEAYGRAALDEVAVQFVRVGPEAEHGEVVVSYTTAGPPNYTQERHTETQLWYHSRGRWFVQPVTRLSVDGS